MAEVRREAGLKIGIIGLGKIGQLLANFLMRYGDVYPNELFLVCITDSITHNHSTYSSRVVKQIYCVGRLFDYHSPPIANFLLD